jgi:hypothetical protein
MVHIDHDANRGDDFSLVVTPGESLASAPAAQ